MHIDIPNLKTFIYYILKDQGFTSDHAQEIMQTVVSAEIDGCHSHGIWRILGCIQTLHNKKVSATAEPIVKDIKPGLVQVDAKGGFSPLAFKHGLPYLIDKVKNQGIAAMAINHCVHFSALWVEVEQLTHAGLVAFAFTPSHAWVTPEGGRQGIFGTNPMAFGWPRKNKEAFIFDFATSAVARGEIQLHLREGKSIPEGWGVDREGKPCTDPQEVLSHGAMLAFGGHKGATLATMIELISGPLIADLTSHESLAYDENTGSLPYHGELIIALDPESFLGGLVQDHFDRAEFIFQQILDQNLRLPSQRRYKNRQHHLQHGLNINDGLYQELLALKAES
ncbi:Ldh family oxidoreductase [Acinetobacter rathckeae]|uniref:Ldh family oxidoreductase n=1 Tax=Acinetobacter rathckeae TaxID=2605272 RepID=UPI0018A31C3F|nr:Ldh family oxidoreductase [Acinetobacter rathckeae]MBF7687262.1 Ldh family oxidoreductase [Acinetobacter rathckeae]MBF7694385.1 Ldh family oxidoreductase [Acinetobacter rathckeae]